MDEAQLFKAFSATVQASLHGLQSLEPLLEREQAALTGVDAALLEQAVQEKLALLKQLEPSVQARDRLQRAAGLAAGLDAGGRLVDSFADEALTRDWQEMLRLARSVAALNDRNSQLASHGQRTTRAALGILTGRPAQDDTYSTLRRKRGGVASYSHGSA